MALHLLHSPPLPPHLSHPHQVRGSISIRRLDELVAEDVQVREGLGGGRLGVNGSPAGLPRCDRKYHQPADGSREVCRSGGLGPWGGSPWLLVQCPLSVGG
jgi:hypothetical protein